MTNETGHPQSDPPTTPRWVKVLLIVAILVVAVLTIMAIAGGEHGPGRHLSGHIPAVQHDP
jgi:hypothetical protein